ncbi:CPBP family intramembrane metalloprotease [soil metagenome]
MFMGRYLLFAPSLLLGVVGTVWLQFRPLGLEPKVGPAGGLIIAALLVLGLLGGAWLLDKTLPSFRYASRLMERALATIPLSLPLIVLLAAASSLAEELFFRGALLPLVTVWGQALLFGMMHPATRKGWSYTAYTFVAGLAFGYATLLTGSLWPAVGAHFIINFQGFWEVRQQQKRRRGRSAPLQV